MKKFTLMLLVLSLVFALASCNKECKEHVDADKNGKCDVCEATVEIPPCEHADADNNGMCDECSSAMTYAKFAAAAINDEVTVITFVQAKQGHWNNDGVDVATFYTQAQDGAYFLYDMPCSAAEYAALVPGTCIKVTGYKAEWSGEVEIVDATFEILSDVAPYIATATDITADIAAGNDVIARQNQLVAINNATVAAAPMYKWDGSGSEGDDIYLTLTVGDKTITVVVESYLHGNGSAVYEAIEALEVGATVSVDAFLYWYNGAQPHVNNVR